MLITRGNLQLTSGIVRWPRTRTKRPYKTLTGQGPSRLGAEIPRLWSTMGIDRDEKHSPLLRASVKQNQNWWRRGEGQSDPGVAVRYVDGVAPGGGRHTPGRRRHASSWQLHQIHLKPLPLDPRLSPCHHPYLHHHPNSKETCQSSYGNICHVMETRRCQTGAGFFQVFIHELQRRPWLLNDTRGETEGIWPDSLGEIPTSI